MSYAIPTNELTATDIKQFKNQAMRAGIDRALALGIAKSEKELTIRSGFPRDDFGAAATTGWVANNYTNPAIAAAGWGSAFSNGALPGSAQQLARTKVAVFYKFANTSPNPMTNGLRFRLGQAGASTKASFFHQLITEAKLEPDFFFSEAIVYDPEDFLYIELNYTGVVAAGGQTFPFETWIIERVGGFVS